MQAGFKHEIGAKVNLLESKQNPCRDLQAVIWPLPSISLNLSLLDLLKLIGQLLLLLLFNLDHLTVQTGHILQLLASMSVAFLFIIIMMILSFLINLLYLIHF